MFTAVPYINSDSMVVVEYCDFWVVRWNVSVELLLVEVPFDRVQVVALQVVVASKHCLVTLQSVRRDDRIFQKFDAIRI
jgi:hypothetical protein